MTISALIIGIDGWEQYTRPLVESLQEHEPDCRLVIIDNGSDEAYPDEDYVHRVDRTSYGAAINAAVKIAGDCSWYVVMNNDVLCAGPFADLLGRKRSICGPTVSERLGVTYVDAWLMAIPSFAWEKLGEWDEGFVMSSYGDLDYCARAAGEDIPITQLDMPFTHLESGQRLRLPGFNKNDMQNYRYFRSKHGV